MGQLMLYEAVNKTNTFNLFSANAQKKERIISNGQEIRQTILSEIGKARTEICLAMAYFTDMDIAGALIEAEARGVEIRLVVSDEELNQSVIETLRQAECKLNIISGSAYGMMNHKFCIIDRLLLMTGSYNYTNNAYKNNKENLLVTDSVKLIRESLQIFEDLLGSTNIENKDFKPYKNNFTAETTNFTPTTAINNNVPATSTNEQFIKTLEAAVMHHHSDFDPTTVEAKGFSDAENNAGNLNIFVNECDTIYNEAIAKTDKDPSFKELLKVRLQAILERFLEYLKGDKATALKCIEREHTDLKTMTNNDLQEKQRESENVQTEMANFSKGKSRELADKDADIAEASKEIDEVEKTIIVDKFLTVGNCLKVGLLALFMFYLSIFFASSVYKILLESSVIENQMQQGLTVSIPPLLDANAILKLFETGEFFYGILSAIFFLIPLLLMNLKIIGVQSKAWNWMGLISGSLIFDVIVAFVISKRTASMEALVHGSTSSWTMSFALEDPNFYMIFIFGAIPLLVTKVLLSNIVNAYNHSCPEYVAKEQNRLLQFLRKKLSQLTVQADKIRNLLREETEKFNHKLDAIRERIKGKEFELAAIDHQMMEKQDAVSNEYTGKERSLNEIYSTFEAGVESGKLLIKLEVDGKILHYKRGFYRFLSEHFSPKVANEKIQEIESRLAEWYKTRLPLLLLPILMFMASCSPQPKAKTDAITYDNIIILADLSSRLNSTRFQNKDISVIEQIASYWMSDCVKPGIKIGDKSSISFAPANSFKYRYASISIDLDEKYKSTELEDKQRYVNSPTGLKKDLEDFIKSVKNVYSSQNNSGGLDLISLVCKGIGNGELKIKNDDAVCHFRNHLFIFTDGYLEFDAKVGNTQYYFGEKQIQSIRKYCEQNDLDDPMLALQKHPEFKLKPYRSDKNGLIDLYVMETLDRGFIPEKGVNLQRAGMIDNDILKAVWTVWATESGFKSINWQEWTADNKRPKDYIIR
jgi:HKD family nuclease